MEKFDFYSGIKLDREAFEPLYLQLFHGIQNSIESGRYGSGTRIPPELEIAKTLNISRITVRQAMDELMSRGIVYREQGRGTFVSAPQMEGIRGVSSFTEDMRSRGKRFETVVLSVGVEVPDDLTREKLKLSPLEQTVRMVRKRIVEDEPWAIQYSHVPCSTAPGLEEEDLTGSLFYILRKKYQVYPAWTEAVVSAREATSAEALELNIREKDVVLVVDGVTYTDSFDTVEAITSVYNAAKVSLYMGRQRHTMG